MIKTIIIASLVGLSFCAFAEEAQYKSEPKNLDITHFIGGAIYYDHSQIILKNDVDNTEMKSKSSRYGLGFSYDRLDTADNYLFQLNTRYSGVYGEKNLPTDGDTFYSDHGVNFLFNYFVDVENLNKYSGFFVGGGVGIGNISTMQNPMGEDLLVLSSSGQYMSVIADVGFMQTLDDIPLMWNVAMSYHYDMGYRDFNDRELQDFESLQMKFGLSYVFK